MLREIFGKKLGMTQIFDKDGNLRGVSLVEVEPVCVLEIKQTPTKTIAKIGCFKIKKERIGGFSQPHLGYFRKKDLEPYALIREVSAERELELKKEFGAEIFNEGDTVKVQARSKGRGFSGGMKRHNWHGGPQSHGSMTHRRIGSNGANTDPGRVVRGHRMPGHYGDTFCTVKNLKILKVDKERNLLFILGGIPGAPGSLVKISKLS